jgi:hypothetical protein
VVSYRALKGLNRIRDDSDLSYSQESFVPLLQIWAREYYELINIESLAERDDWRLDRLLRRTLEERKAWTIERIFRGLELYLPWGDAYFSYRGFTSDSPDLRENAIELIDSRIRGELRQTLLPLFSEKSTREIATEGRNVLQLPSSLEEAPSDALFGGDPWLKCCIIAEVAARKTDQWKERINRALNDINPLVQESAQWVLSRWEEEAADE